MKNRNRLALYDARGTGRRLRPRNAVRSGRPVRAARGSVRSAAPKNMHKPSRSRKPCWPTWTRVHPRRILPARSTTSCSSAMPRPSRGSNVHLPSWRGCPVLSLSIARSSSTILPHSVSVTSAMPEPLLKRALALSERSLVANHPAIGRALTNLATTYEKPGRALAIREAAVGPDHPDTASVGKQSRLALPGRRLRCRAACGADDIPCTLDPEIAERAR